MRFFILGFFIFFPCKALQKEEQSFALLSLCKWDRRLLLSSWKKNFILSILTQAYQENLIILKTRVKVSYLEKKSSLSHEENLYLRSLFSHYHVSSLTSLMECMDIIPLSLVLAQAIEESGWGRSFYARTKNACFGMYGHCGGKRYCLSFSSLKNSVIAYMDNLNKHRAYRLFRQRRKMMRAKKLPLYGTALAVGLKPYSSGNYPKRIAFIIHRLHLELFDREFYTLFKVS